MWCRDVKKALAFPKNSVLLLQLAHPPAGRSVLSFHLEWIRTTLTHGLTPLALECDPPAHHRCAQPSTPGSRRNHRACIQHQTRHVMTILRCQTTTAPITGTLLAAGTHTRLMKCQQHKPNPRAIRVRDKPAFTPAMIAARSSAPSSRRHPITNHPQNHRYTKTAYTLCHRRS